MERSECTRKGEGRTKRVVNLWDGNAVERLLEGVQLASLTPEEEEDEKEITKSITDVDINSLQVCDRMFCTTCCVNFEERDEQREHFKSDWHHFNLKRRLKGQESIAELKFEEITSTGDLSSISGSESSDPEGEPSGCEQYAKGQGHDDEQVQNAQKRHPKVFLRNNTGELFSIYRCVIYGKKDQVDSPEKLLSLVRQLAKKTTWLVIMLSGGHFAAAVFKGNSVVAHKTFHRYVIRAKRGTVQSSCDNKGHAPKSAGATLRRYNESALVQDIQELLKSWEEHVKTCHRIFIRAPTYGKHTFYGSKAPMLDKNDPRIRLIPFQTRRPTLKEVHRVHNLLAMAECYGTDSSLEDHIHVSPRKVKQADDTSKPVVTGKSSVLSDNTISSVYNETDHESDTECNTDELSMTLETEVINTGSLKLYEIMKKPRKKTSATQLDGKADCDVFPLHRFTDPESSSLRNHLYTACKTKNTIQLESLLQGARDKFLNRTCSQEDAESTDQVNLECPGDDHAAEIDGEALKQIDSGQTNDDRAQIMSNDIMTADGVNGVSSVSKLPALRTELDLADLLNCPFGGHGLTLLHVAARAGHKEGISLLMEFGADPSTKDGQGQLPYITAVSKETRNEFRRFMAKYPEKFDYQKAQIPGPLSEEQEMERKVKEAERRKLLKKARKERMKEQKAHEAKQREEEEEKRRFLALSDREKRALAADKRLAAQAAAGGKPPPVLSRCFQCAADITGKVPYEYDKFKFCTTKCLKQHRMTNRSKDRS